MDNQRRAFRVEYETLGYDGEWVPRFARVTGYDTQDAARRVANNHHADYYRSGRVVPDMLSDVAGMGPGVNPARLEPGEVMEWEPGDGARYFHNGLPNMPVRLVAVHHDPTPFRFITEYAVVELTRGKLTRGNRLWAAGSLFIAPVHRDGHSAYLFARNRVSRSGDGVFHKHQTDNLPVLSDMDRHRVVNWYDVR